MGCFGFSPKRVASEAKSSGSHNAIHKQHLKRSASDGSNIAPDPTKPLRSARELQILSTSRSHKFTRANSAPTNNPTALPAPLVSPKSGTSASPSTCSPKSFNASHLRGVPQRPQRLPSPDSILSPNKPPSPKLLPSKLKKEEPTEPKIDSQVIMQEAVSSGSSTATFDTQVSNESAGVVLPEKLSLPTSRPLTTFDLKALEEATNEFSPRNMVGRGGFGNVFRGSLQDEMGKTVEIAVKKLNIEGLQGEREWNTEIDFLGHLEHAHLVKLIGKCADGKQRMLVYEYMSHGSLDAKLFSSSASQLGWQRRVKIAIGAAKGLTYLHEEAPHQVIYRDFKTSNILLDARWEAHLADFGLARDGPEGDNSHVTTRVVGTPGYAAPEYVMTGHLTSKSDVWAFGVVLLELLTGKVALDKNRPREEQNLVDWAETYLANCGKLYRIMDPKLGGLYSAKGAKMVAMVAQQCLKKKPKERPKMSKVLEGLLPVLDLHDMAGALNDSPQLRRHVSSSLKKENSKRESEEGSTKLPWSPNGLEAAQKVRDPVLCP